MKAFYLSALVLANWSDAFFIETKHVCGFSYAFFVLVLLKDKRIRNDDRIGLQLVWKMKFSFSSILLGKTLPLGISKAEPSLVFIKILILFRFLWKMSRVGNGEIKFRVA